MIEPGIFKRYDIRGKVGDALTEGAATQIGQAFGTILLRKGVRAVVVGHDNRTHSRMLADAAIDGLTRAGMEVTDLGMASTPVVYWSAVEMGSCGGMMVTGSHLAPTMNGFKLSIGKNNIYGDQLQTLRQWIDAGDLFVELVGMGVHFVDGVNGDIGRHHQPDARAHQVVPHVFHLVLEFFIIVLMGGGQPGRGDGVHVAGGQGLPHGGRAHRDQLHFIAHFFLEHRLDDIGGRSGA